MGLEIPIEWLSLLLFGSLAVLLMLGLPMAFCTGSLATIFLFVFGTPAVLNMMPSRIFPFMTDYQLSAVPLFIFMAAILEKAGIIEELFDVIYKWLGSLKGGLASATVVATSTSSDANNRSAPGRTRRRARLPTGPSGPITLPDTRTVGWARNWKSTPGRASPAARTIDTASCGSADCG